MQHLHEQGIIHRDIKSQNVVMERPLKFPGVTNVVAKLADYGFAFNVGKNFEN
jgi:serine/threonine protein kinase